MLWFYLFLLLVHFITALPVCGHTLVNNRSLLFPRRLIHTSIMLFQSVVAASLFGIAYGCTSAGITTQSASAPTTAISTSATPTTLLTSAIATSATSTSAAATSSDATSTPPISTTSSATSTSTSISTAICTGGTYTATNGVELSMTCNAFYILENTAGQAAFYSDITWEQCLEACADDTSDPCLAVSFSEDGGYCDVIKNMADVTLMEDIDGYDSAFLLSV
ncbi:hypothetical protein BX600DRAFT_443950 [Xylariales sp. PMI_506]|nr:hypothetical protein BX600DRAFT_443950 [Xylariales sp. PMI_506]